MPPRNSEKNKSPQEIASEISQILVINNFGLKPYIELFEIYPENNLLQPLGTLTGFYQIADTSDDSAYIVNFLTSVTKKEYYINHRRSVSGSLDSALHKVNLALAEIAKNGNIRWIGKLNGAACVFDGNSLNFSVCGNAKVLLLRKQTILDISQDFATDDLEINPLKTFSSVSSGRLEPGDKVIITSNDLFTIFSTSELRKAASRFSPDKFVQFLQTALVNELDVAGTIIADITAAIPPQETPSPRPAKIKVGNVFSESAFKTPARTADRDRQESSEQKAEYTDKQTGHIYIQGDEVNPQTDTWLPRFLALIGELSADLRRWIVRKTNRLSFQLRKKVPALWVKLSRRARKEQSIEKSAAQELLQEESPGTPEQLPPAPSIGTGIPLFQRLTNAISGSLSKFFSTIRKIAVTGIGIMNSWVTKFTPKKIGMGSRSIDETSVSQPEILGKNAFSGLVSRIFPSFSKVRSSFSNLSPTQKIYATGLVTLIFIAPLIYLKIKNFSPPPAPEEIPTVVEPVDPLLAEKNNRPLAATQFASVPEHITGLEITGGFLTVLAGDKVWLLDAQSQAKEYPLPAGAGMVIFSAEMEDLNLILILTDQGRLFSFSPISREIKENLIELPPAKDIRGIGTYLTYLYVVDGPSGQVWRYPRAEGGFGKRTGWLKEDLPLDSVSDIAIDENVYLLKENEILKMFRGKREVFAPEKTAVEARFIRLMTDQESLYLYALDKTNGRLIKYAKDGTIATQYIVKDLQDAGSLTVDEQKNQVFFSVGSQIKTFAL